MSPSEPDRSAFDQLAVDVASPISRRRGLKWALSAALVLIGAPRLGVASALTSQELHSLGDEAIITQTDALLDVKLAGQDFPIFGLVAAAITFYEAAEVLESGPPSEAPPPGSNGISPTDCEPGSFYCGCFGGFCLISGADCTSYC
jgi:hypothetical protein